MLDFSDKGQVRSSEYIKLSCKNAESQWDD